MPSLKIIKNNKIISIYFLTVSLLGLGLIVFLLNYSFPQFLAKAEDPFSIKLKTFIPSSAPDEPPIGSTAPTNPPGGCPVKTKGCQLDKKKCQHCRVQMPDCSIKDVINCGVCGK